jgi:hypothetical protein
VHHQGGGAISFALEWIVYRADFELRLHRQRQNSQMSCTAWFSGSVGIRLAAAGWGRQQDVAETPGEPGGRDSRIGLLLCD